MDFVFFLGRLHVLALHLPIGIILATVLLEMLARSEKYRQLARAGTALWGLAAITSILTVALGYMHFAEGGFDSPSGQAHRLFGTSVAVVASLIWWLRARQPGAYAKLQIPVAVLIVALVSITGHYGGNLTHGASYLVDYAPQPIRTLAGLGPSGPLSNDLSDDLSGNPAEPLARAADPAVIESLYEAGFLARQVSQTDPRLIVSVNSRGSRVTRGQLDVLLRAAPVIHELDLAGAGLVDDDLAGFETLSVLVGLNVSNNALGDAGVARLRNLPALETLNIYGNPDVTDAAVEAIAGIEMLNTVYVWQTAITAFGIERLRALRPVLDVETGSAADFLSKAADAVAEVED